MLEVLTPEHARIDEHLTLIERLITQGSMARNRETVNSVLVTMLVRDSVPEPVAHRVLARIRGLST